MNESDKRQLETLREAEISAAEVGELTGQTAHAIESIYTPVRTRRTAGESQVAAVTRVLRLHNIKPSNGLVTMLIDAVRDTTPPPLEVTIGMLTGILRSLDPADAVDAWTVRSAREIVTILSKRPEVKRVAELVDDESIWRALEGTISGMLSSVCRGQDLHTVDNTTGQQVPVRKIADDLRRTLQEAIGVAKRLDEHQHFTGRIEGWRDLAERAEKALSAP